MEEKKPDDEWDADNWFYGPPESRPKRQRVLRSENRSPEMATSGASRITETEVKQPRLSLFEESLGCFNVFKRQRDALSMRNQEGPRSRVFSFEHSSSCSGGRRYLVTTVERFWRWYKDRNEAAFYELIPDKCPARLFFDLEFYRESNPDADESKLVTGFSECLSEALNEMFAITFDFAKHMLVLDASTKSKFSEHIIVHLPGSRLFPSCISMKPFVSLLEKKMIASDSGMVFNADGDKRVPVCDTGVYTLNRNFRLFLSSKLGKNNPLKHSKRCRFYESRGGQASHCRIFCDSLIVPPYEVDGQAVLEDMPKEESKFLPRVMKHTVLNIKVEPTVNENFADFMSGYGLTSPFPILEHHILTINRRWREGVSIRMWKLSKNLKSGRRNITYYLSNCRYCFNIEREHRSNGVYWVVDLDGGFCYQKCFDVDCKGTSSNHFPLPYFVRASVPSLEDVEKASVADSFSSQESSATSLATLVDGGKEEERTVRAEKDLQKVRRRSAAVEKIGTMKAFDSFYDADEDKRLLDILDEFENVPS